MVQHDVVVSAMLLPMVLPTGVEQRGGLLLVLLSLGGDVTIIDWVVGSEGVAGGCCSC